MAEETHCAFYIYRPTTANSLQVSHSTWEICPVPLEAVAQTVFNVIPTVPSIHHAPEAIPTVIWTSSRGMAVEGRSLTAEAIFLPELPLLQLHSTVWITWAAEGRRNAASYPNVPHKSWNSGSSNTLWYALSWFMCCSFHNWLYLCSHVCYSWMSCAISNHRCEELKNLVWIRTRNLTAETLDHLSTAAQQLSLCMRHST